jgi:hypothetical protein
VKTLGAIIVIVPLISIRAEHRGLDFHRRHWYVGRFIVETSSNLDLSRTGIEKTELEKEREEERRRWASLNTKDKLAEWTAQHQLSVIVGSWALTMGLVGSKVMRDPCVFLYVV